MADFGYKSAIFGGSAQVGSARPSGRPAGKLLTAADFAYELCHTKRRVNADKLARIT